VKKDTHDPLNVIKDEPKKMAEVALTAINQYNNKAHIGIRLIYPYSMEDALFRHYNYKKQQEKQKYNLIHIPKLTKNVNSDEPRRI